MMTVNRKTRQFYHLFIASFSHTQVKASDNGRPQKSNSCLVLINLVPVLKSSPNPPTLHEEHEVHVSVLESDSVGHHVKLVEASDEDGDQLWFDIIGEAVSYSCFDRS